MSVLWINESQIQYDVPSPQHEYYIQNTKYEFPFLNSDGNCIKKITATVLPLYALKPHRSQESAE